MTFNGLTAPARTVFFPVDFGWRNYVFSLRTAAAAILALAISFWLELKDPQWATLTVYVLAQPTVGAALAKGAWRALGTVIGALVGLVLVALFSQTPEGLVGVSVVLVGVCFYLGARLRNFSSYGVMIGGFTMLLVAFDGSANPLGAWSIAVHRATEVLIGIGCGALASVTILPRYAADALRQAQADVFNSLALYVVKVLRLSTPHATFAEMRRQMVAKVVSLDALRSYALFEASEFSADQQYLARTVNAFLIILAIARGLFVRLNETDGGVAPDVRDQLRPALEATATRIERIVANPLAWRDSRRVRSELLAAQMELRRVAGDVEAMAAPFDQRAEGLLILNRVHDGLHALGMIAYAGAASLRNRAAPGLSRLHGRREDNGRLEAIWLGLRAALVVLLLSGFWIATGWNEGFNAVSGGAIMLFFATNQDNPVIGARAYLIWSLVGMAVAYAAIAIVLPFLQGFEELAIVLFIALLPAGLMLGTPREATAGLALGAWTIAEIGFANDFKPNELAFVNNAVALALGMILCLTVIVAIPVNSRARREQVWRRALGRVLPDVARGETTARRGADEIVAMLTELLPRLALEQRLDEVFFTGALGAASSCIEIGRLRDAGAGAPPDTAQAITHFLAEFAIYLEAIAAGRPKDQAPVAKAEACVTDLHAELSGLPLPSGPAARAVLSAASALRFLADRFTIDQGWFQRRFVED